MPRPKKVEKLQETVKVKDYGDEDMNRFAVVVKALSEMNADKRHAALGYLKATFSKEWPSSDY